MTRRLEAEQFLASAKPYIPKYLYKYRSMKTIGVEDIFSKRKIFFPDATLFDDPFECRPELTVHKNSFKKEKFLKQLTRRNFPYADKKEIRKLMKGKKGLVSSQSILRTIYNRFIKTVGIYCLSEFKNNLIMWSLYSDSHRGFCIEFNSSIEGSLFWEAFKVNYNEKYPTVNVMNIAKADEFQKALLTKFIGWKDQNEWRVLKLGQEGGPGNYQFPSTLLTGVIFGALMSEGDKSRILNWIDKFPTKISVYEANLNRKKYQVDIVPYDKVSKL